MTLMPQRTIVKTPSGVLTRASVVYTAVSGLKHGGSRQSSSILIAGLPTATAAIPSSAIFLLVSVLTIAGRRYCSRSEQQFVTTSFDRTRKMFFLKYKFYDIMMKK